MVFLAIFAVAAASAYRLESSSGGSSARASTLGDERRTGPLPRVGMPVPAYDLASDPVFPTLRVGYAIERHVTQGGVSEGIAQTDDAGRRWRLVGVFPFENGYNEVQFVSVTHGYAFGPAGVAFTRDGGRVWTEGQFLGGQLQRVVPIGSDVWATYVECSGPPEPTTNCRIYVAISVDGGLHWRQTRSSSPVIEAYDGGDVLARVTLSEAYLVSYGVLNGELAMTDNSGRTWHRLSDPCADWRTAQLAALWAGQLWMICGGAAEGRPPGSAKAVFQSRDGGRTWTLRAYTGFGPVAGPLGGRGPTGEIPYGGVLSQLATISPTTAWIGASGLGVLVTYDAGRIWRWAPGFAGSSSRTGVGVTFNDRVHGWAIEFDRGVYQTVDGFRWTLVDGRRGAEVPTRPSLVIGPGTDGTSRGVNPTPHARLCWLIARVTDALTGVLNIWTPSA